MVILSQQKYYCLRVIEFAQNHSIAESALRYKETLLDRSADSKEQAQDDI